MVVNPLYFGYSQGSLETNNKIQSRGQESCISTSTMKVQLCDQAQLLDALGKM